MKQAFAKALRAARKLRGLTQEDFALVSSRTYLSSLERGQQNPTLEKITDLARTIGIHPLSLLTLAYCHNDNHNDINALFATIRQEIKFDLATSKKAPMIRILIAEDHKLFREGLKQLFSLVNDIHVVGEADTGQIAIEHLERGNIDLLLLDMRMPGVCGKELIAIIRVRYPDLPILVLSMHLEPIIVQSALDAGASGYLTKDQDPHILLLAIRTVADGGRFIDPKLDGNLTSR